jgi:hypothetical protein
MRISLTWMVIVLSTEAFSFTGCGKTDEEMEAGENASNYKITYYVPDAEKYENEGEFGAWVEEEGRRFKVYRRGDMIFYEQQ